MIRPRPFEGNNGALLQIRLQSAAGTGADAGEELQLLPYALAAVPLGAVELPSAGRLGSNLPQGGQPTSFLDGPTHEDKARGHVGPASRTPAAGGKAAKLDPASQGPHQGAPVEHQGAGPGGGADLADKAP